MWVLVSQFRTTVHWFIWKEFQVTNLRLKKQPVCLWWWLNGAPCNTLLAALLLNLFHTDFGFVSGDMWGFHVFVHSARCTCIFLRPRLVCLHKQASLRHRRDAARTSFPDAMVTTPASRIFAQESLRWIRDDTEIDSTYLIPDFYYQSHFSKPAKFYKVFSVFQIVCFDWACRKK